MKADTLLDALLDDISGPLVDETSEHFDVIAAALRRPDVVAFLDRQLARATAPPRLRTGPPDRQRIIARAVVQRAEIEQIFTDIASWNDNSTARQQGAEAIDPDPDGSLRRLADGLDRMLAAEIVPGA